MTTQNQFSLLAQRRFAPFFVTQFLGAFNDNIFRNGLIIVITFQGIALLDMNASQLANAAGALFILPFFLFSATAGQLADKYEKSMLMRRIKILEICLMLIATLAFVGHQYGLLFLVLFLMGCQSTLFGPVKYAYLPQQLGTHELIGGNALVESGTYIAIIMGLVVGGLSVALDPDNQYLLSACLLGVAVLGYLASRSVPETRAVDPGLSIDWNLRRETWRIVNHARQDRAVFMAILGISWFWFYGSAVTLQIPAYTLDILNGNEAVTTVLLVAFAVGVGIGSLLCEKFSKRRIELGLVPFGAIGLSVFAIDLYGAQPVANLQPVTTVGEFLLRDGTLRILADVILLGAFGGLYSVPLYAYVQSRADRRHLSRIIAANNILNALFMVCAAVMALTLLFVGLSIPQLFLALATLNALVATYLFTVLPEFFMRFLAWIIINTLYRIRATGVDKLPQHGPAVIVCNHVSYMDALIISGSMRRIVHFVMWYRIFEIPLLKFLFRTARAIPIASAREDKAILDEAFERIDEELASGHIVCIFPEGQITWDGEMNVFRPGIEKILERRPVPVVPIALSGMWGSWFSRSRGGGLKRLPGKLFARVDLRVGDPVPAEQATAAGLEALVKNLRGQTR